MHDSGAIRAARRRTRIQPSCPANGSRERAPDDRLRRGIQYSVSCIVRTNRRHGVLDRPVKPDCDGGRYGLFEN
jgi:hypothetical protein